MSPVFFSGFFSSVGLLFSSLLPSIFFLSLVFCSLSIFAYPSHEILSSLGFLRGLFEVVFGALILSRASNMSLFLCLSDLP